MCIRDRFIYGLLEKQFRGYYDRAKKMEGITGENLLKLLELRLDNVIYRLGLAKTRRMARQIIVHGHILVNGKKVDIPSYSVKVGDVIALHFGERVLAVEVLDVSETAGKSEASLLYREVNAQ